MRWTRSRRAADRRRMNRLAAGGGQVPASNRAGAGGRVFALLLGAFLLGAVPSGASAQDAGARIRDLERREDLQRLERMPEPVEEDTPASREPAPEQGETIFIERLRFAGRAELLSEETRRRLTENLSGRRAGLAAIRAAADEATAALQEDGRLLARAVLPPQDITDGVVTIEIVEGTLERIELESGSAVRAREERLRAIGESHAAPGRVTLRDLEEALLRINDHPGVTARARLTPGTEPNTSKLVIDVDQAPRASASIRGENFGSASTGESQANAALALADLTGYGDLTRLSAIASDGQTFAEARFAVPLGASGFVLDARYGHLDYRSIDDVGRILQLEGEVRYAGLGFEYGVLRSRNLDLRLTGAVTRKALVDDSAVGRLQNRRSESATLGISGSARDRLLGAGLTSWSLDWAYGDLDLSRVPSALAADQQGLDTHGHFHRVGIGASRLQSLTARFSLFGRLYGQWASRNLDSSEDFALGGPYGVRGYPVGEGRGDEGLLGTVELRYDAPIPARLGGLQLAVLLDAGRVRINRNPDGVPLTNACGCNSYDLKSAGIAARWARERASFSASWARALDDNPGRSAINGANVDGGTGREQLWLHGAIGF